MNPTVLVEEIAKKVRKDPSVLPEMSKAFFTTPEGLLDMVDITGDERERVLAEATIQP